MLDISNIYQKVHFSHEADVTFEPSALFFPQNSATAGNLLEKGAESDVGTSHPSP